MGYYKEQIEEYGIFSIFYATWFLFKHDVICPIFGHKVPKVSAEELKRVDDLVLPWKGKKECPAEVQRARLLKVIFYDTCERCSREIR
jgi:hypothetical protein